MSDSDEDRWSNSSLWFLSLKHGKKRDVRSLNWTGWNGFHNTALTASETFKRFQYLAPQLHLCSQHRHPGTLLCNPMRVQALVCGTRQSLPVVKPERQEQAWMSLSWSQPQHALRSCQCSARSSCFHDSVLHPLLLGRLSEQHGGRGGHLN